MPDPALVFAFILATLLGVVFHLLWGGDARRLALFLVTSWMGFMLGQVFGLLFEVDVLKLGGLRLFPAVIGSVTALFAARALTTGQRRRRLARRSRAV